MLARIVFTNSYGAFSVFTPWIVILSRVAAKATGAPRRSRTRANVCVSLSLGTLRNRCTPGVSSVAAITGSAAVFAAELRTAPPRASPPPPSSLPIRAPLLRRQRLHRQRMDFLAHPLAERCVDELMALHAA